MFNPEFYFWSWLPDPDNVQLVSLPLEIVGLCLALIEIFYPDVLLTLGLFMGEMGKKEFRQRTREILSETWVTLGGTKWIITAFLSLAVAALYFYLTTIAGIPWFGAVGVYIWIAYIAYRYSVVGSPSTLLRVLLSIYGFIPFTIGLLVMATWSRSLSSLFGGFNWIGRGKVVGGIGLLLASIGIALECYQVSMLDQKVGGGIMYWGLMVILFIALFGASRRFNRRISKTAQGQSSDPPPPS